MPKKSKIYDYLIILSFALVALGDVGGSLQPLRVLFICLFPIMLYESIQKQKVTPFFYTYDKLFFALWLLYAFISLYWSLIAEEAIKSIVYLFVYIIGFFEILWLALKAEHAHESICKGWLLAFIITIPIAVWEFLTDNHLSYAFQETGTMMNYGGGVIIARKFASIAFGNLNSYNTFLCLVLPFILISLLHGNKRKGMLWMLLVTLAILIVFNSSRAAILTLGCGLVLYIGIILKDKSIRKLFVSSVIIIIAIVVICAYLPTIFEMITYRFEEQGFEDNYRMDLLLCGWDALKNSSFMGIGIGNFMPLMEHYYKLEITAPHNLWLEIGVQFGIVIFVLFLGLIVRQWSFSKKGTLVNKQSFWLCFILLLPTSIINSGYLTQSYTWMFLAAMCVMSNPKFNSQSVMCTNKRLNSVND